MSIKDCKLIKGMTREEVNYIIGEYLLLEDDVYLGVYEKHNWKCKCGNTFERKFNNIKSKENYNCGCIKYNKEEERYKTEVEKDGEYEYIRSYRKGDILPNGKISKVNYIKVKHLYCGSEYIIEATGFINSGIRCSKCCGSYENSFAYHIEVELGEQLEKYWDFDENTVNPYYIYKNSNNKVWIKCQNEEINKLNGLMKKNYHGSYQISCDHFTKGGRCSYCNPRCNNVHIYDSFGYKNFNKVCMSWHRDNNISPFKVANKSIKKYKFICETCGNVFTKSLNNISQGRWCPECSLRSKGEKEIRMILRFYGIDFEQQKTYENLLGLGNGLLSYDFYLSEYNLLIEYQGEQHEKYIKGLHLNKEEFNKQLEHDRRKKEYAIKNKIELLEIWYYDYDNIEEILEKVLTIN